MESAAHTRPPPLPESATVPGPRKTSEELLAGYDATSGPRGAGVKGTVMRGIDTTRKRFRALKLRYEVKNLQTALEGVWENLGTLVLTHRPSKVDVSAELAELSQVQDQLGQKQSTADSLRQAKGGRPVLKEVEAEIAELRDRQRRLMMSMGQKAEAAKPDMPGATAHYSALERLRPTLESKHRDLEAVEQKLGPLWQDAGERIRTLKRPVVLAAIVLIAMLVVYMGWRLFAVPGYIKDAVFEKPPFSVPVTLRVPGEGELGWDIIGIPGGQSLLNFLTQQGYASIGERTIHGIIPRRVSVLRYSAKIKPRVFKDEANEEVSLQKPFRIVVAQRRKKSIEHAERYEQLGVSGWGLRFSYTFEDQLPGIPRVEKVFEGTADVLYNPTKGEWEAMVDLDDQDGEDLYVKLIEERFGDRQ